MSPEKWQAVLIAAITALIVAGGLGVFALGYLKASLSRGVFLVPLICLYAYLVVAFVGVGYVEQPVLFGARAGILGAVVGIISSYFQRPLSAT